MRLAGRRRGEGEGAESRRRTDGGVAVVVVIVGAPVGRVPNDADGMRVGAGSGGNGVEGAVLQRDGFAEGRQRQTPGGRSAAGWRTRRQRSA